jgi:hypothetical protein
VGNVILPSPLEGRQNTEAVHVVVVGALALAVTWSDMHVFAAAPSVNVTLVGARKRLASLMVPTVTDSMLATLPEQSVVVPKALDS